MKKYSLFISLLALLLTQNACNQEYLNPSAASEQQVVNSPDGLVTLVNGLQYRYTFGRTGVIYNGVAASGLATRELRVLNAGNTDELFLEQGFASVQGSNAVIRNLWTSAQLTRSTADIVLSNANRVITDAGLRSGVVAYASIFKALSLGTMAQFFQQAPVATGTNAAFVSREQLLRDAISTLESAATLIGTTPPSAAFLSRIPTGIDITNTIQALIARYALFVGDYDKAIAAAGRVNLATRSSFSFDDNSRNPVFETAFSNTNVFAPTNTNFGLPATLAPDAADRRIAFYTRSGATATQNLGTGFYTANTAPVPVYLPGEMLLIRAEAYARKNDVANAVTELNRVLTKTAAQDAWGVGAGLPAYSGAQTGPAVLTEIYRNRQIELAFQGFRLEDSRRFSRPGPETTPQANAERTRNFLPYPFTERDNNSATPADPTN
ncbi:RagB/SusD family nutrient uptake outer membrane protein [Spirosoma sordidisoli]|uniref:RagB/SusD family nutrient uptake outer membrane protein n=1 Tax=Spirosoma sordidisoli TaxID=2502893 RepID=A0A4Q2UFW7_9BACT|nr:RagB/SusD family nutrient uptake outer membrane protein [Spirosoma sordidisoli]RYC68177.1 RagB/SusD family nutrient uptake outer membrane protein [Spirosoma sordidisoli]